MSESEILLKALVKQIDEAASLPVVIYEVLRVCDDPRSDAGALSEAVSADPVLAAKLVRMANSAYFGLAAKTADIRGAVVRLGVKSIRNAALGLSLAELFDGPEETDGFSRPNVWRHSVAVATLNELLAARSRVAEVRAVAGEAFLVGLVHDIGVILADQYGGGRFADLPPLSWKLREPLYKVERDDLGFDHQTLGAEVLRKWKFPARLVQAVRGHHRPGLGPEDTLAQLTALSEQVAAAKKIGYADQLLVDRNLFGTLAKRLGLGTGEMSRVSTSFDQRLPQALEIFTTGAAAAN